MTGLRRRVGDAQLLLRDMTASDTAQVLTLHQRVFGDGTDAHWFDWKYGSTRGRGQGVGAWVGDELIAFCGGVPRTLWQNGRSIGGLQIGDVMVHPRWRGILTRHGPFFHVSRQFYDSRLGGNGQPFALGYGFPSERHLKLAVLLGLLRDEGRIESLQWQVSSAAPDWPCTWRCEELHWSDNRLAVALTGAWTAMQGRMGNLRFGERDTRYLCWRYRDRALLAGPLARNYRLWSLRRAWSDKCQGVLVLQRQGDELQWLDWIGAPDLLALAQRACMTLARRLGAHSVSLWASNAVASSLAGTAITQRSVCAGLGVPSASASPPAGTPGADWWLMGGDTDFL